MLKKFVKLCKNHKKVLVFPVLHSKVHILLRFSKKLRRRASARLQLLEALSDLSDIQTHGHRDSMTESAQSADSVKTRVLLLNDPRGSSEWHLEHIAF